MARSKHQISNQFEAETEPCTLDVTIIQETWNCCKNSYTHHNVNKSHRCCRRWIVHFKTKLIKYLNFHIWNTITLNQLHTGQQRVPFAIPRKRSTLFVLCVTSFGRSGRCCNEFNQFRMRIDRNRFVSSSPCHAHRRWKFWRPHATESHSVFCYAATPKAMSHCGMCPTSPSKKWRRFKIATLSEVRNERLLNAHWGGWSNDVICRSLPDLTPTICTSLSDAWNLMNPPPVGILDQLNTPNESSIKLTASIYLPQQSRLVVGRQDGSIIIVPATQTVMLQLLHAQRLDSSGKISNLNIVWALEIVIFNLHIYFFDRFRMATASSFVGTSWKS